MRKNLFACLATTVLIAVPAIGTNAQTVYPIDRAAILSGSKFDFKVELPGLAKAEDVAVLINGEPYDKVLGQKAMFIEREDGDDVSSLLLRDAALTSPGSYTVQVRWNGRQKEVRWEIFDTPRDRKIKNVIFILGDGLSVAHRTGARILSKGNTEGKANGRLAMDSLPRAAFIGTSSTDSIAADSANTMSAYMTGHKSAVNALGVYASRAKNSLEHPRQETIAEILRRNTKMSVGIVTNAEVEDATPAAVVAHTRRRADKAEIARMLYDFQPEVLMGGGSAYFLPKTTPGSKRKDDTDYIAKFRSGGYTVVTNADELQAAGGDKDGKLLGLFHTGNMDGTLDQKLLKKGTVARYSGQPDLPDMMKVALDRLSRNPDGFFLMIEGALVDKYSHPLDWDRALYDTITLDKVVGMARDFAERNPDTLIVLTGDHTHGISLIGTIDDDKPGDDMREKVGTYADAGFPNYTDEDGDGYPDKVDVSRRLAVFSSNFPDYYETFRPKLDNPFVPAVQNDKKEYVANEAYKDVPGAVLRIGNLPRNADTGVHSLDDVVLQAQGPGSEKFQGYMENSDVFRILAEGLALGAKASPEKVGMAPDAEAKAAN